MACDASVISLVHGQRGERCDQVEHAGRRTRTIPPPLRRLLWARDGGCRFPGCTHRLYVHAHHIEHWAHGGPTTAENLVLLCSTHHRFLHEGGFRVERSASGQLTFRNSRGKVIADHPEPLPEGHWIDAFPFRSDGVDETSNFPAWDGEHVDYDAVVTALL